MPDERRCAFCGRAVGEAGDDRVLRALEPELTDLPPKEAEELRSAVIRSISQTEPVEILVPGPGVYICDQCVDLCVIYIEQERRGDYRTG